MATSSHLRLHWTHILIALLIMMVAQNVWALEVPPLKNRVNDYADLINPSTQRQLEAALAQLEQTDSTQIAVLTITSLQGDSLEDFSIRVVDQWKLGQKESDNGVLLLISKNDRKIRIEVGYGLEGKLTDLISGQIIRHVISPQFKRGRFDQGIIDGVSALVGVVRGEFTAPPENRRRTRRGTSPGFIGLIALFFFMNMLSRINRFMGAGVGAVLAPIAGVLFFKLGLLGALLLIPLGFGGGFLMSLFGGPLTFGHTATHRRGGGYWGGGGFGGGGFGGGGFGGGGGGFGGGGASGGW